MNRVAKTSLPLLLLLAAPALGINECNSTTDDADLDGFSVAEGDCDDTDASVNPIMVEQCDDGKDSNCDGDQLVSLEYIQDEIFNTSCISCHGITATMNMDLREGRSLAQTVNVPAQELPTMFRLRSGDPDASYLIHKLRGTQIEVGGSGEQMPLHGLPLSQNLQDAMEDWIRGGLVESCGADPDETPSPSDITWYKDVQPIVVRSCQNCHTAGGVAPFPLDTYQDAATVSAAISASTTAKRMPPWMPNEACQTFKESRSLTQAEIQILSDWDNAGAPEGDPADATGTTPPSDTLARVDLSLNAGQAFTPSSTQADDYHCFVLNPNLTADRYVTGHHVKPDERSLVHHVLIYAGSAADAIAHDNAEAGVGYTCFGGPDIGDERVIGTWVPGDSATQYPTNTGLLLKAGEVLVMQIHYNTSYDPPAPDLTTLDLQIETTVSMPSQISALVKSDFNIPANSFGYTATTTYTMPLGAKLWGIFPHMHQMGTVAGATLKRGTTNSCLIDIPDWQFNWQQFYFYDTSQGLSILKGDQITISCTWDNSTDQAVTWGEGTADEMCITYFYLTF